MTGDWLAFIVGWARDIIGSVVILGGLAMAFRVLWLAWRTGNQTISSRFARPAKLVEQSDPAPVAAQPPADTPGDSRGLYGGQG